MQEGCYLSHQAHLSRRRSKSQQGSTMFSGSSVSFGRCRLRGPIAVSELMHFFHATHQSINNPSRADRLESASFNRPLKRIKTEAAFAPPVASTPQAQIKYTQQSQVNTVSLALPASRYCCLDKVARQGNTWFWIMTNDNVWSMTAGSEHPDCGEEPRWL